MGKRKTGILKNYILRNKIDDSSAQELYSHLSGKSCAKPHSMQIRESLANSDIFLKKEKTEEHKVESESSGTPDFLNN